NQKLVNDGLDCTHDVGIGIAKRDLTSTLGRSEVTATLTNAGEAAVMLAVVVAALYWEPATMRGFEAPKVWLVRSLALLGLPLLVLRRRLLPRSLMIMVGAWLAALAASTALAVAPSAAIYGSYLRQEGALTELAWLTIFGATAIVARQPRRALRLVRTLVMASVPVAGYALMQALITDPRIPIAASGRPGGTIGSPLMMAGFLVAVIPLTLVLATTAIREARRTRSRADRAAAGAYALILVVQSTAVILSGSRGPLLGLLGGAAFVLLAASLVRRSRAGLLTALLIPVAILIAAWVARPDGYRRPGTAGPSRLAHLLDVDHHSSASRTAIWDDFFQLVTTSEPLLDADGQPDRFSALRPLLGFGPESQISLTPRLYGADLAGLNDSRERADRAHNELWDALLTRGALGAVALVSLVAMLLGLALKGFGLRGRLARYVGLSACGAVLGALGAALVGGPGAMGPGAGVGLIGGVVLAMMDAAQRSGPRSEAPTLLLYGLAGTLVTHWLELQVGVPSAAARAVFWVSAGVLVGSRAQATDTAGIDDDSGRVPGVLEWVLPGAAGGLLLLGLTYSAGARDWADIWSALPGPEVVGAVLVPVALWVVVLPRRQGVAGWLLVSCVLLALPLARHTFQLALPLEIAQLSRVPVLTGVLVGGVLWLAAAGAASNRARIAAAALVLVAAAIGAAGAGSIRADAVFQMAEQVHVAGRWPETLSALQLAETLAPHEDQYPRRLANRLYKRATLEPHPEGRTHWVKQSLAAGKRAQSLAPFKLDPLINRARVWRWWAGSTPAGPLREARGSRADELLARAEVVAPDSGRATYERGLLRLAVFRDRKGAARAARASVARDPTRIEAWWLLATAIGPPGPNTSADELHEAARAFERCLEDPDRSLPQPRHEIHLAAVHLYAVLGDVPRVQHHVRRATPLDGDRTVLGWKYQAWFATGATGPFPDYLPSD
ncbi:MAG: hypothetical protein ACI9WU_004037, partial [Myxococcota bacterium]